MNSELHTIGSVEQQSGLTADTLRYYEKICLLRNIPRQSGQRRYTRQHLDQLQFIRRAQSMDFSLAEIAQLLQLREDPVGSRDEVRHLAEEKLDAINQRLKALRNLQKELKTLVNECQHSGPGKCPIISGLEHKE